MPWRLASVAAVASMLPDLDVLAFRLGIPYSHPFGHRGASHSLAFAVLVALVVTTLGARIGASRRTTFLVLLTAVVSHPLLDAMTDGGLGVALFWPFSNERFFAPFRPIHVAPISPRRLLSGRAGAVFESELLYVWLPCLLASAAPYAIRLWSRHSRKDDAGLA